MTCICVFEGVVEVRGWNESAARVPAGQRRTFFSDGTPTQQAEMRPDERVALDRLRQRMHAVLE